MGATIVMATLVRTKSLLVEASWFWLRLRSDLETKLASVMDPPGVRVAVEHSGIAGLAIIVSSNCLRSRGGSEPSEPGGSAKRPNDEDVRQTIGATERTTYTKQMSLVAAPRREA